MQCVGSLPDFLNDLQNCDIFLPGVNTVRVRVPPKHVQLFQLEPHCIGSHPQVVSIKLHSTAVLLLPDNEVAGR